ncbi:substrate-binding periplasmic protein [Rhodoferax aquaticus]|uniref:Transporter substrate-binding domain-containing protein n=1 Tax=Rhodoferax aquaticus TaxID=2527691 RepID=A0A515EVB3_9BURK|nr:amino acid ABC transporter substrate-binding protein [Rhodoferax aquaticus]QDL56559.1 hypothetical protein EXZ61_21710 [Rhodoferax aquaticus]
MKHPTPLPHRAALRGALHFAVVLWWASCSVGVGWAQAPQPLLLGTPSAEGTYGGSYIRRVYKEWFARLGIAMDIQMFPMARLTLELDKGRIDGDTARALAFGESHPKLLRVGEPVMDVGLALWATNPKVQIDRLEDLATSGLTVSYARGVLMCEQLLRPLVPLGRLVDVTGNVNALEMMYLGRLSVYCGADVSVISDAQESLPNRPPPIKVLDIGKPTPLFLYLQPKHAELVAPLTSTLKKMRTDGTLERIRKDTQREFRYPGN